MKLRELNYKDAYGPEFVKFRKKYLSVKKDYTLFVQFTNMQKGHGRGSSADPDHSDPKGVYAYPLWYVISHPGDIWYGQRARHLRVLRNRFPQKTLQLQYIDYSDAKNLCYKAGVPYIGSLERQFKSASVYGKVFFQSIQRNYTSPKDFTIRTAEEQTNLLLKTGYLAIEDRSSRSSQAVINDREPVQICFLHPSCFEVMEVFNLRNYQTDNNFIVTDEPSESLLRNFSQYILENVFEDKIAPNNKGKNYDSKTRYDNTYASIGGRLISIKAVDMLDRTGMTFSSPKPYRRYTLDSRWLIKVDIRSEYGKLYASGYSLEEIVTDLQQYIASREIDPNWVPYTIGSYEQELQKEYDDDMKAYWDKENAKKIAEFNEMFSEWEKLYVLLFKKPSGLKIEDDEDKLKFVKLCEGVCNIIYHNYGKAEQKAKSHYGWKLEDLIDLDYLNDRTYSDDFNHSVWTNYILPMLSFFDGKFSLYNKPRAGYPWGLIAEIEEGKIQV